MVLVQEEARVFGGLERGVFAEENKWFRLLGEYFGRRELLRVQSFLKKGHWGPQANNPDNFFSDDFRVVGPKLLHAEPPGKIGKCFFWEQIKSSECQ